ncbi:MAG TPA: hypothetical protein PKD35_05500 [Nitrosomonas sp.]|nr:hypothetical protein [Nitrosomonas sp.]
MPLLLYGLARATNNVANSRIEANNQINSLFRDVMGKEVAQYYDMRRIEAKQAAQQNIAYYKQQGRFAENQQRHDLNLERDAAQFDNQTKLQGQRDQANMEREAYRQGQLNSRQINNQAFQQGQQSRSQAFQQNQQTNSQSFQESRDTYKSLSNKIGIYEKELSNIDARSSATKDAIKAAQDQSRKEDLEALLESSYERLSKIKYGNQAIANQPSNNQPAERHKRGSGLDVSMF